MVFAFPDVAFAPGSSTGRGQEGATRSQRNNSTTAGPPVAIKLTPMVGPAGIAGRWRGRRTHRLRGRRRKGAALSNRRRPGRLHYLRARNLARWLQQRQTRFDEQSVSEHRMRHQPCFGTLHSISRNDYDHCQLAPA